MIKRIEVALTQSVKLPRFNMNKGDKWEVRPDRFEREGFKLGGGFINNDQFEVTNEIRKRDKRSQG